MQDWESMTQLLLDNNCGLKLSEMDEIVLVEIMSCAVRRATGTNPPAGRTRGKVSTSTDKQSNFCEQIPLMKSEHNSVSF